MNVLGINAVFHDPAAALVVDGTIVAAAEEERFSRRKHGKSCVPFSAWELPIEAARFCLERAGITAASLDAIAYGYDPALALAENAPSAPAFESLRTSYAKQAPSFLAEALPGLDPSGVRFVPHHLAHGASAFLAGPARSCALLVVDGRGESTSHLSAHVVGGIAHTLAKTALPHSLGLRYEDLTEHLGFHRSSDEYKIMALASYGRPRFRNEIAKHMYAEENGEIVAAPIDLTRFCRPLSAGEAFAAEHADLASSMQAVLEETLLVLARQLKSRTGERTLALAGGVALNVVANSRLARESGFESIWIQPAAGDAGTALGAACYVAEQLGDRVVPMRSAALGREWSANEIRTLLEAARVPFEEPADIAEAIAEVIARDGIVGWFQGRSEFGPRALGNRSLLANPAHRANLDRLNDVKGRERFRPVAPMTLLEAAATYFEGPLPSPYMLFVHRVKPEWANRLLAVTHVDGTARVQTVDPENDPLLGRLLRAVGVRTGAAVVVNTSFNTAGRPMVDTPRDALEVFGSAPIDALALGPFLLRRTIGESTRIAVSPNAHELALP